jgi:two-component system sensor histidine kinase TctE
MTSSLRIRLLCWILLPLAVFAAVSAVMSYRDAQATASLVQDRALLASAKFIAEQVNWDEGTLHANVPPAALELFQSPDHDRVYLNVSTDTGVLLAGTPAFPATAAQAGTQTGGHSGNPYWFDAAIYDQPIRAVAYTRAMYDAGKLHQVTIAVGKTTSSHDHMVRDLWRPSMIRQLMTLLLACVLVVGGLTFELRPIVKLKNDVIDRGPMQLVPIQADRLQSELRPVVDAINRCIQRLNFHVSAQRRFIADAAHQLRTPLALLDTQIQFARKRDASDPQLDEVLGAMQNSSHKMVALTNKLLLLAQAEALDTYTMSLQEVDLVAISVDTVATLTQWAGRREIDLGIEPLAQSVTVNGNPSLLLALLSNLVDNAIRYSPDRSIVTVTVAQQHDSAVLIVADNGPGIAAEARTRVFERFYRGGQTGTEGTGLGLAIVKEIVSAHNGSVSLSTPERGSGLHVTVRLPLARQNMPQ